MTEVEITEDTLIVHVLGWDRLWAFKRRIEVPLSHVLGAEVDPEISRGWWKGVKAPGTEVPGVTKARHLLPGATTRVLGRARPRQ